MGIRQVLGTSTLTAVADESDKLRLLVASVGEYAIFLLAPDGTVMSRNAGAERLKGYSGHDIVGRHFGESSIRPRTSRQASPNGSWPGPCGTGFSSTKAGAFRNDGTRFWAHAVITALYDGPFLRGVRQGHP